MEKKFDLYVKVDDETYSEMLSLCVQTNRIELGTEIAKSSTLSVPYHKEHLWFVKLEHYCSVYQIESPIKVGDAIRKPEQPENR